MKEHALEQKQRDQAFELRLVALEMREQVFLLKQQGFEQSVRTKEETYKLEQQSLEQSCQALVNEQNAIGLKRQALLNEQKAIEVKHSQLEQAFELKQRETELDLQRREDALSNQIEQHTADVKNDRAVVEQERQQLKIVNEQELLSLQQLKAANEQEKARLLELERQIKSLVHQQHQDTCISLFNSFHIENLPPLDQFPDSKATIGTTTMPDEVVPQQLSKFDLCRRQLKQMSQMVEKRYDNALRLEYTTKQIQQEIETQIRRSLQEIETQRQNSLQEIETQRQNSLQEIATESKREKLVLREKIRSGQFDVLSNGNDDIALGLIKYAMFLPLDRLKAIQTLKLDPVEANRIISLSDDEWINDSAYVNHILEPEVKLEEKELLSSIIKSCKANSEHYGKTDAHPRIEYHCPQLGKQYHFNYYHCSKLIDVLYSNQGATCALSNHVNPYDPSKKYSVGTIFNGCWKSDYKSGKIPKLTPDLFFSTPNVANGEWIQFHGPGTKLNDVDPTFVVYVGSLCDPNKEGTFTSKNLHDSVTESNTTTYTSSYQISIKWE